MDRHRFEFNRADAVTLQSVDAAVILDFIRIEGRLDSEFYHSTDKIEPYCWIRLSLADWVKELPWLGETTIRGHLRKLRKMELIRVTRSVASYGGTGPNLYLAKSTKGVQP